MNNQFSLDESDVEVLGNLVLRSQQSRTREALCLRIGIDPRRLWFIKDSADADFVIQLINHLNEIGNQEALCKLCCLELFPIFSKSEKYAPILSEMAAKLHCNQVLTQNNPDNKQTTNSSIPTSTISINTFHQFTKKPIIRGIAISLIVLAGFSTLFNKQNSNLQSSDSANVSTTSTPTNSPITSNPIPTTTKHCIGITMKFYQNIRLHQNQSSTSVRSIVVYSIHSGSSAASSQLKEGDMITAVNGESVTSNSTLIEQTQNSDNYVNLRIIRPSYYYFGKDSKYFIYPPYQTFNIHVPIKNYCKT